jgi:hypothetical protein
MMKTFEAREEDGLVMCLGLGLLGNKMVCKEDTRGWLLEEDFLC